TSWMTSTNKAFKASLSLCCSSEFNARSNGTPAPTIALNCRVKITRSSDFTLPGPNSLPSDDLFFLDSDTLSGRKCFFLRISSTVDSSVASNEPLIDLLELSDVVIYWNCGISYSFV